MVKLPQDLLDRLPEEGARRIALAYLDEARAALARCDDAADGEALHDFRVAVRRLRSTLRLWRAELRGASRGRERRALREVQQASGAARDAEVALAWLEAEHTHLTPRQRAGARWLIGRLRARREAASAALAAELRAAFAPLGASLAEHLPRLQVELDLRGERPPRRFGSELQARVLDTCEHAVACLAAVGGASDRTTAHAARIACKRLRYLVEPAVELAGEAAPLVKRCKELQDVLGELNDAHNLLDELREALRTASQEQADQLHALALASDAAALRRELGRGPRSGLIELTLRVQRRIAEIDSRGVSAWGPEAQAALRELALQLAERLAAPSHIERERKYLLDGMPELPGSAELLEIEQGWLPGDVVRERLRRQRGSAGEQHLRTVKLGSGLQRFEFEEEISAELFAALWPATAGLRIRKRRHRIREGERVWEIDEFLDRPLLLAEVELPPDCDTPELPAWLAPRVVRDVTEEAAYTNRVLAAEPSAS